jgi:large subunit ribosomal protein L4
MISVPVFDSTGNRLEDMQVDEATLGGAVKTNLLRLAVFVYESRKRQCTKGSKNRALVEGSGRKLYRQKHTGMARAGMIRVPQRRGGGHAHGLHSPNYRREMPRGEKRAALCSALLARLVDGEVAVFVQPQLDAPKTKIIATLFEKVNPGSASCLVVTGEAGGPLFKSARNIAGVSVLRVGDLNALEILRPERVLFTKEAIQKFMEGLS